MIRIAEQLEFMKVRVVTVCAKAMTESSPVCAKAMTESSPGHSNPSFLVNSRKNCLGKEKS
jgi:hypothetical protein